MEKITLHLHRSIHVITRHITLGMLSTLNSGEVAHITFSGASLGLRDITIKSFTFNGYLSISDKRVSNINCKAKPALPYDSSLSFKSSSSNLVSVGLPTRSHLVQSLFILGARVSP